MKTLIKPVDGKKVPNPLDGSFISPDGICVDVSKKYWIRRIAEGCVCVIAESKESKPKKVKNKEKDI